MPDVLPRHPARGAYSNDVVAYLLSLFGLLQN
jgi:hypothetical protein